MQTSLLARRRQHTTLPRRSRRPQIEHLEDRLALSTIATTTDIGPNGDYAFGVGVQSNGQIVVAGTANRLSGSDLFAVARYNPDLTLDTSFGSGGIRTTAVTSKVANDAYAMTIDTNAGANLGKIVVAGSSNATRYKGAYYRDLAVVRYTTSGALDTSFGGGKGYVLTNASSDPTGNDEVNAVAIDQADRIVAAGYASNGSYNVVALARYTPQGALDATFNSQGPKPGTVTLDLGERASAFSLVVDGQGNAIVVGTLGSSPNFDTGPGSDGVFVARFTASGALDPGFGSGGVARFSTLTGSGQLDHFNAVALDAIGNIVVAGYTVPVTTGTYAGLIARFTPTGSLDATFGAGLGWVEDGVLYRGLSVAIQPGDGAIVLGGYGGPAGGFGAVRFLPDGSLDTSFNGTGRLIYTFPNPNNVQPARGLALGPSGNIVLAGWHDSVSQPPAWGVVNIQPPFVPATLSAVRPTASTPPADATPDPLLVPLAIDSLGFLQEFPPLLPRRSSRFAVVRGSS